MRPAGNFSSRCFRRAGSVPTRRCSPICAAARGRPIIPGRIEVVEVQTTIGCGGVQVRPGDVVAEERHAPVREDGAGLRLGGVVQERGPAQRLTAGELVRERLGQQRLVGEALGHAADSKAVQAV